MLRKIMALTYCLLVLFQATPVLAESHEPIPTAPALIISEVYANAPGSTESGTEYVELYNAATEPIDLTGYSLSRKNTTFISALDGLTIEPESYLVVSPTFALVNSGATLILAVPGINPSETIAYEVTYPALSEDESWSLVGESWQKATPTPGLANPIPEPPTEEEPLIIIEDIEELPPVCLGPGVVISEIMANPGGADTAGGEFVELYNSYNEPVFLKGCLLTTDKQRDIELPDIILEPGSYLAVGLADKLLNAGGKVTFTSHDSEASVVYPALKDDEAWALIDNVWQITEISTAGAANLPTPPKPATVKESQDTAVSCPAGKFRNPETNRCKNVVETASTLLPCGPGQSRNPETNRCRKITASSTALTPCKPDQVRNPATNRCRKITTSDKSATPCQPGYERNPDTNRCRKQTGVVAGAASLPVSGPAPLHPLVLIFVTSLALAYGVYEYRMDLGNWYEKLRTKLTKQ